MVRFLTGSLALIVLLSLFYAYGPAWPDDPRHDDCTFGLVPNTKYQEFLNLALKKTAGDEWPPIKIWPWLPSWKNYHLYAETAQAFRVRFESFLALAKTDNERIAAIHAAARAMGGRYEPRSGRPGKYDFNVDKEFHHIIGYRVDNRQLGNYFPLERWNGVNITLTKTSPISIWEVTFGGVMGWEAPPFDWRNIYLSVPPSAHLCPPSFAEHTSQQESAQ
jgi:hypothetical protein